MSTLDVQRSPNYFRIAWQSAVAAALCLGLPAGLLFWLIILQRLEPSQPVERLVNTLQNIGILEIIGVLIGAFGWGTILSKITGYHSMWWLVAASMLSVYVGRRLFWVIYAWINFDFSNLPARVSLAIHLCGLVLSVTFCTGLAYGLVLRSGKAVAILAITTSLTSVLTTLVTFLILDQLGMCVGTGNGAMPKVTAICTMAAAISGGTILSVLFSRFVGDGRSQLSLQIEENS